MINCGTDIVEIKRFNKLLLKYGNIDENNKFLKRIFTIKELVFFKSKNFHIQTIAGRFSAKESVIKAISLYYKISTYKDIEILNDIPKVYLKKAYKLDNISVSISHETNYAISFCIVSK
jgi:holo-[acyl-carrier protein] synthase